MGISRGPFIHTESQLLRISFSVLFLGDIKISLPLINIEQIKAGGKKEERYRSRTHFPEAISPRNFVLSPSHSIFQDLSEQ